MRAFTQSHWRGLLASLIVLTAAFALTSYLFINGYLFGFMVNEQWISRDEFFDRAYNPEKYGNQSMSCYGHWSGVYLVNHCFNEHEDLIAFMDNLDS